jgi:hypothetical protein
MNCKDKALFILGGISAIIAGALIPSLAIVMGAVSTTFDPAKGKDNAYEK